MADDSQTWGSRKWRLIKKQQARLNQANAATPHLDAARAELASGPKLVVESLEEKLERALPGAITRWSYLRPGHEGWQVRLEERVLGTGASEREAIDVAVTLWGGR